MAWQCDKLSTGTQTLKSENHFIHYISLRVHNVIDTVFVGVFLEGEGEAFLHPSEGVCIGFHYGTYCVFQQQ